MFLLIFILPLFQNSFSKCSCAHSNILCFLLLYLTYLIKHIFTYSLYMGSNNTYNNQSLQKIKAEAAIEKGYKHQSSILNLNWTEIGNQGFDMALKTKGAKVNSLYFLRCRITGPGLRKMADHNLSHIKILSLIKNEIGSKGVKWLIKSDLPNLQKICLSTCLLGNEAFTYLSKSKWPKIHAIQLLQNCINPDGWRASSLHRWQSLKKLQITDNHILCWLNLVLAQFAEVKIHRLPYIQNGNFKKMAMMVVQERKIGQ